MKITIFCFCCFYLFPTKSQPAFVIAMQVAVPNWNFKAGINYCLRSLNDSGVGAGIIWSQTML